MAKNKYYAVRKGRVPGIYRTWSECQKQVTGYPGAVFKGFVTEEEAQSFLHSGQSAEAKETHISHTAYPYAYVCLLYTSMYSMQIRFLNRYIRPVQQRS